MARIRLDAMLIVVASLMRGSQCRRCLLPSVVVDLSGVERLFTWLLTCTWGSSCKLFCHRTALAALAFSRSWSCSSVSPS
jgi:hypothetical protein